MPEKPSSDYFLKNLLDVQTIHDNMVVPYNKLNLHIFQVFGKYGETKIFEGDAINNAKKSEEATNDFIKSFVSLLPTEQSRIFFENGIKKRLTDFNKKTNYEIKQAFYEVYFELNGLVKAKIEPIQQTFAFMSTKSMEVEVKRALSKPPEDNEANVHDYLKNLTNCFLPEDRENMLKAIKAQTEGMDLKALIEFANEFKLNMEKALTELVEINILMRSKFYYTKEQEKKGIVENDVIRNKTQFAITREGDSLSEFSIWYKPFRDSDQITTIKLSVIGKKYKLYLEEGEVLVNNFNEIANKINQLKNDGVEFEDISDKFKNIGGKFEAGSRSGSELRKSEKQSSEEERLLFKPYAEESTKFNFGKKEEKSIYSSAKISAEQYDKLIKEIDKHYTDKKDKRIKSLISVDADSGNKTLGVTIKERSKSETMTHSLSEESEFQITLEPPPPSDLAINNILETSAKFKIHLQLDKNPNLQTVLRIYESSKLHDNYVTINPEDLKRLQEDKGEIGKIYNKLKGITSGELKKIPGRKLGDPFEEHPHLKPD